MTVPGQNPPSEPTRPPLLRIAIWVAIGALIAAALVSVVWVLIGTQNGIVGRAFLTILLLASFAGVAILDTHLAARRPVWFALVSMASWIVTLLIGAFLIWMPFRTRDEGDYYSDSWDGVGRVFSYILIILIVQLAVLHIRLTVKGIQRNPTVFIRVIGYVAVGLVVLLTVLLLLPLTLHEWFEFHEIHWRLVVATAILAAVATALVPLVNVLFAPRRPRAEAAPAWPTFVDGVTPLPVLPDGSPDWNAYYTGYPTGYVHPAAPVAIEQTASPTADAAYAPHPQADPATIAPPEPQGWTPPGTPAVFGTPAPAAPPQAPNPPAAPQYPGYEGYPPAPPLPPQR